VNTWLRDQGYLAAEQGLYVDTDWARTRAYSLGVNGHIYLNQKGRERHGVVDASDRDALLDEIAGKLMKLVDPETGKPVLRRVYRADEWYSGPEAKHAPDLILGYDRGYRASWNTCLGDFDKAVIVDNTNAWSADHCVAHDLVPGVLLSNREILVDKPALIDVAPSILSEFGIPGPETMTGRSFFKKAPG
jgi:predicted AlkP superfamily phosphohydrolase/phosphomutase